MELLFGIALGLLILMLLVAAHEFGHAIAAIRSGVVVEEFGIGFPPRAWGRKLKNGIFFTLNWLPLGGFVRFQGEYDSSSGQGDYGAASYLQKTKILLAGVVANWIVAAILLAVLSVWTGIPKILPNQFFVQSDSAMSEAPVMVAGVVEGSPADKAGLEEGDELVSIAGQSITWAPALRDQTSALQGEDVEIVYLRSDERRTAQVRLNTEAEAAGGGYLGLESSQERQSIKATWSAPVTGAVTTAQFSWATLVGVKDLAVNASTGFVQKFSPDEERRQQADQELSRAADSVAGPIGILGVIFPAAAQAGVADLMFLTAIISLTLAVMNVLPIPALDGGRWLTMTVFRLLRTPLTKEREEVIQGVGFMALIGLIIVVTVADIGKFF